MHMNLAENVYFQIRKHAKGFIGIFKVKAVTFMYNAIVRSVKKIETYSYNNTKTDRKFQILCIIFFSISAFFTCVFSNFSIM